MLLVNSELYSIVYLHFFPLLKISLWINNLLKNTNQIFQQNITGQNRSLAIGLLFWASHLLDFDPCAPPYSMLHMQKKDGIIIILKIYLTRPQLVVMG